MSLMSCRDLLQEAYKKGYGIGEFTMRNFEFAEVIVQAARECGAPVIIGVHKASFVKEESFENASFAAIDLVKRQNIPLGIHLDHAKEFSEVAKAIDMGINSVMLDVSELPFEENVRLTRKVVEYAHPRGVNVEGELGHLTGGEGGLNPPAKSDQKGFTDPLEAQEFVERTGIDYLTVSIGTVHGRYAETPRLDYDRLARIREKVKIPLILHGGSGTPCKMLQKAIALGVARINIYTDYALAADDVVKKILKENPDQLVIPDIVNKAMDRMKEVVKEKIKCFTLSML